MRQKVGLIVMSFVLLTSTAIVQELPEVNEVMDSAIRKVLEDERLKAACFTYNKKYTEQRVEEKQGKIVSTDMEKQELYNVFAKNGVFFEELIEKNGRPPSQADQT